MFDDDNDNDEDIEADVCARDNAIDDERAEKDVENNSDDACSQPKKRGQCV